MKATNIAFTGIPVTDIKRARAFYEGALGLTPAGEFAGGADAFALAAGDALAAAAGEFAALAFAEGAGALAAGDVPGEVDGAGDGDAFSSSDGARLPMFERSGPSRILPRKAGLSKM